MHAELNKHLLSRLLFLQLESALERSVSEGHMTEAEKAAELKEMASRHKLEVEASQAQVHYVIIK